MNRVKHCLDCCVKEKCLVNKVIAIVGMCGSGKSVLTNYLEESGCAKFYFGGVTLNEVKARGLEVNETNERMVREELRKEFGPEAYAVKLKDQILEAAEKQNVVLDGLYSWYEYKYLKDILGDKLVLVAVILNRAERYARLSQREFRPLNQQEAFLRDCAEIENLAKGGPLAIADYFIMNDGTMNDLIEKMKALEVI